MGDLPNEKVNDVLTSLTNSSMPDLFDILLQLAKTKALDTDTYEGRTLEQVKTILSVAADAHHSLCIRGKWHVHIETIEQFNVVC